MMVNFSTAGGAILLILMQYKRKLYTYSVSENSIRANKMKISPIYLVSLTAAEKKVPPRHPIQRLNRLVEFSKEILDSGFFNHKSGKWNSIWKNKFENNAGRMEKNFNRGNQRCGFYDEQMLPHGGPDTVRERREYDLSFDRYDRENPCIGIKNILTGFSKWASRYLASCSGQKNFEHQTKRMERWEEFFYKVRVQNIIVSH